MGRYKNVIMLFLMMVMAIFIAGVVSGVANMLIDSDNQKMAADTSLIALQIMEASDEKFVLNMVNSSEYPADCLSGDFVLQKKDEEGVWQTIETMQPPTDSIEYKLPSGENRSFWFYPVAEGGETVLSAGEYQICKSIYRDLGKNSALEDLTITTEFSYPQVLSERMAYDRPVEEKEHALKLARTILPEQEGMEDYWSPTIAEADTEAITAAGFELTQSGRTGTCWEVAFPMTDGSSWTVWVAEKDGSTYGPVRE